MLSVWFRAACFACLTLTEAVTAQAQEPIRRLEGPAIGGAVGRQVRLLPERSVMVNPLIDGDRSGFASAWTNNFCLRWTDGCSTCSRDEVWDPIRCEQHDDRASCRPSPVRCEVPDNAALSLSCENYSTQCNLCWPSVEDPESGNAKCTLSACRGPSQKDFACYKDWAFYERWYCQEGTPDEKRSCQLEKVAQAAAKRSARPRIAFPGLRR